MAHADVYTMSASITHIAALSQFAAMGCGCFDIGVLQQSGWMLLRDLAVIAILSVPLVRVVAQTLREGGFGG
jgi:hypothetical protein